MRLFGDGVNPTDAYHRANISETGAVWTWLDNSHKIVNQLIITSVIEAEMMVSDLEAFIREKQIAATDARQRLQLDPAHTVDV